MRIAITAFLTILFALPMMAQSKKTMTPEVYKSWKRIRNVQLSDNGDWTKYELHAEQGNRILKIHSNREEKTYTFDRVRSSRLTADGSHVVYTIGLDYEEEKSRKRKKVKEDDLPKDTLCIYRMADNVLTKIPNVKSFQLPAKWSGYVAYLKEPEPSIDTLSTLPKESKARGSKLFITNLETNETDTLLYAKAYGFSDESKGLAAVSKGIDSLMAGGVYRYDFKSGEWNSLFETDGDVYNLSWDKTASQLAFTVDQDTTDARVRPYQLYHWTMTQPKATLIADQPNNADIAGAIVSNHTTPYFSEDGTRLFFGVTAPPILQDTSILDEEIVDVEVWHYQDDRLYTRQENNLKNLQKKDYLCMYDVQSKKIMQIQKSSYDRVIMDEDNESRYAVGMVTEPYESYRMHLGHGYFDAYRIDLKSGKTKLIAEKQRGNLNLSPSGRYAVNYDATVKEHNLFDLEKAKRRVITTTELGTFYDELNDRPMDPWDYGSPGFTEDESSVLLYDRYDIWQISTNGKGEAKRLTDGRSSKHVHRLMKLDREQSFVDLDSMMIHRFDAGTSNVLHKGSERLDRTPIKAKLADDIITTVETYQVFPDLVHTDLTFDQMKTISYANPQQEEYNWGSIELHPFRTKQGINMNGILVLPDGFDPQKKYPLLVNFYERSSDRLHQHRAPYAHRSTINYTYYASKGYVIFNPDIIYRNGQPGQSCYDAVIPAVQSIIDQGYIDESRIGVQGHSWGGYQIADLLTKTDMFKCAESGAPVVNMVSAYGGIRWGSGMSRMFQYEKTQSRLGATLWENPDLYLDNSPIFNLDKVNTPVLILHNDQDGAVPWYQGIEYFNGLRRLGKPAWLLNYNGEPHWPVKEQNRLDFNRRMEQFFDHYLMDAPMPSWMRRGVPAIEKGIRQGFEID